MITVTDQATGVTIIETSGGDDAGGGADSDGGAGVTFEVSGGHDASGTWAFVPEFSFFDGSWEMAFTDPTNPMSFFVLSLTPGNEDLSFSDGTVTIFAGTDVCTFAIDRQDAGGASGSVECRGAEGGIDISATFDVTT